jgi:hypothetical protein
MRARSGSTVAAGLASVAVCLCAAGGVTARDDPRAAASASGSSIRLGQVVRFPVAGGDAEYPALAMNLSGLFVIAYPQNDPFGSFGALVGRTGSGRILTGQVVGLGTKSDTSPLEPAVASDGRVALGWSVRRQLRPANRVAFGQDVAEIAPGAGARWTVRTALAPTTGYEPDDPFPGPSIVFDAGDRLLEDWTTKTRSTATLVLARQTVVGGPLHDSTVLRTKGRPRRARPRRHRIPRWPSQRDRVGTSEHLSCCAAAATLRA